MKLLRLLLLLLLVGCQTVVKYENGVEAFRSSSNSAEVDFYASNRGKVLSFKMKGHDPAATIRAGGSVVGTTGTSFMGLFLAWLSHGAVH